MNLSNCKTIEEYREAAHYWQKKWEETDKQLELKKKFVLETVNSLMPLHEDAFLDLKVGDRFHIEGIAKLLDAKEALILLISHVQNMKDDLTSAKPLEYITKELSSILLDTNNQT